MKIQTIETAGWQAAIMGMREPMQSFSKMDSDFTDGKVLLGPNDLDLAKRLLKAGSDSDSKFLRQIYVAAEITAPSYFWAEMDTYKVGTTRDSSSLQHKGMSRDYTLEDFTFDGKGSPEEEFDMGMVIELVNKYRRRYKKSGDYRDFRMMRQLMPMGYGYKAMWSGNYQVLRNICRQRKNHLLVEWREEFIDWVRTLPYADDLILA